MGRKKKWKDMSTGRRRATVIATGVQLALQGAALADLKKRTPAQVNGPKAIWVAASFINFAGPILYFLSGRRK
ncbi:PLDc N-terminal domain-containing protein [Paeniglutamicibacter antarcticus]|uniref:PLDc N-terminal domain-containing protein n=1 Tax=Arthrobacter terrae TaxID=2935737 RepID=A0A931CPH2_9MICC|nr:PLDc N-terminal domain-containing protein [Arthrobacter terrae]MBG0740145.1 PLDc N-terminal domain-containing protein [Arthrobacter terrae]